MFEQMDEDDSRCWAFNKAGQRCEMVAGHDRDHNVIIAWGPDECWTPTATPAPAPVAAAPAPRGVCVICDHPMHKGPCRASEGEFNCDCAEGVS